MVELNQPGWLAQYLYDDTGYRFGESQAQGPAFVQIPLPGGGGASYDSGSLQSYFHRDWEGSTRLNSANTSQTVLGDVALAPFGERYANSGNSGLTFAGISTWIKTDLDDAVYREYHPTQGRWIMPDPAGLAAIDPSNPQTWNRYAYVGNNPLSRVDPLGLDDGNPWEFEPSDPPPDGPLGCYYGVPCSPCDFIICAPEGGGGGHGSGAGGSGAPPSGGNHGPWPGNQTTGLPQLPTQPLGLDDLLGFLPGLCSGAAPGGIGFLGTGAGSSSSASPTLCAIASITIPASIALPALIGQADGGGSGKTKAGSGGEVFDCVLASPKDTTANYGSCKYACQSETRPGVGGADIPLRKIQKACPPPRSQCPISLQAKFSSISIWGIGELGVPSVVENSCVYGKQQ